MQWQAWGSSVFTLKNFNARNGPPLRYSLAFHCGIQAVGVLLECILRPSQTNGIIIAIAAALISHALRIAQLSRAGSVVISSREAQLVALISVGGIALYCVAFIWPITINGAVDYHGLRLRVGFLFLATFLTRHVDFLIANLVARRESGAKNKGDA